MKKIQWVVLLSLFSGCLLAQEKDTKKLSENYAVNHTLQSQNPANPLFIIDGIKIPPGQIPGRIAEIDPADIVKIEVVKKDISAALYGEDSKNGVVIITTKKKIK